jgi:hypothetical protein
MCHEIADRWGHLSGARGTTVPVTDGLLAATAIHHNLMLVTRNNKGHEPASHFSILGQTKTSQPGYANELLELRASLHETAHGLSRGS